MEEVLGTKIRMVSSSEMITVVGVIAVLLVMIIPLPPMLLDFLLATNITLSITILLISMFTIKPLDFSIFPTVLLLTTLFRLSLNVASTRLILLHGNEGVHAAGKVIMSFGNFVVSGNYVVGFIIFTILIIVNFIVITKGASRIAEVAARFTLDAMPGKQMSIDADLNAGIIDENEAKKRRATIAQEAEFHGAMDGAIKFVRGDAIAGIIITAINIVGGFIIGVFQKQISIADAATNYTLLTIGDGLVSQIPALIISTAAGIVLSRSGSKDTMGKEFGRQFLNYHKAVYMSAMVIFLFGLIPGLPHFSFIILSLMIGGSVYLFRRKEQAFQTQEINKSKKKEVEAGPEIVEHLLLVDLLELEVGYGLIGLVDKDQGGEFLDKVRSIRRQFAIELGIVIPPIHIRDNLQLKSSEYRILLKGVKIAGADLMVNHFLAMDPGDVARKIEGINTYEPSFNLPAVWIPGAKKEEAKLAGYTVVDNVTVMATHLTEVLRMHSAELLGRQEVQNLLNNLSKSYPKVVEELVPGSLSLGGVQKVLQNLLKEQVPVKDMLTIVETLADYAPLTKDTELLTEYVRHKLARSIISPYLGEDGRLSLITMSPEIENILLKNIQKTEHGSYLAVDPKTADQLLESIKEESEKAMMKNIQPIILTSPTLRRHLKKLVEYFVPSLKILSHSELLSDMKFKSIGEVGLSRANS
ncbi:MAG: flagellar biosynthesis protein FlhA [Desulfobacteraceae bacterium]|nr:MAG: flagellar biosynthesis protein FlhA [Desulfobacteraceae bacterium]